MAAGTRAADGKVLIHDGVGVLLRGDTFLVVYQKPARLERTRWIFDVIEHVLGTTDLFLIGFLLVLPTSDPPDGPTRHENIVRLRGISHRVRRLVTTPIGNTFQGSIVRTIMRGLNLILGHSGTRFVTDTVEEGLAELLEGKSELTPTAEQILDDLRAIYVALGEPEPKFPKTRPGPPPGTTPATSSS